MTLSESLDSLATAGTYAEGKVSVRWGQIIRSTVAFAEEGAELAQNGHLTPLESLGRIRGGVVTRANAYFLVREIPFDQIPARMRVTRGDLKRVAVVADGLDYITKIEREFLQPVIKGPESLQSAVSTKPSALRLFNVKDGKKALEARQANGALDYLRRGETVNFKTSEDDLKGGIPALRSQVKSRRPYWYSLQGEQTARTRIVFPEHIDRRYVFTLVPENDSSVIIDKLYLFEPHDEKHVQITHAALNTLLTWYQVELRGRSQLGEGVLELKVPDFAGLLLLNPQGITAEQHSELTSAFAELPNPGGSPSFSELGTAARHTFDLLYLRLCGFTDPEELVLRIEHALRALAGERHERKLSVTNDKVSKRKATNVAAIIDAYATRIAASIEAYPDPRTFVRDGATLESISVLADVEGTLDVGVELFNQGEVIAGGTTVARTGSILAAQFVKGVLLLQPDLSRVDVPTQKSLEEAVSQWTGATHQWQQTFKAVAEKALVGIEDPRTKTSIEERALRLLHAV